KISQHTHIQSFPKTAGTCKKVYFSFYLQQFLNKKCFIYIKVIPCYYFFKIINSHRQWFPFHKKRLPSQCSFILLPLERRRKTASGKCHQHKSLFCFSHRKYSDQ